MVGLIKRGCIKKVSGLDFAQKSSWIFRKTLIFESVSYHHEMFDVTNIILVPGVCIVHVVIFIKNYLVNLFRISSCELLKILKPFFLLL